MGAVAPEARCRGLRTGFSPTTAIADVGGRRRLVVGRMFSACKSCTWPDKGWDVVPCFVQSSWDGDVGDGAPDVAEGRGSELSM